MTQTCRSIITRAYQLGGIVALGVTPKAKETDIGLEVLQALYDGWVHGGMFGTLKDVLATENYTALENERVRHSSSYTITIPTTYDDDGTEGTDRPPYDLSVIETFNLTTSAHAIKLWDRNSWVTISDITIDGDAPLSDRGAPGLSACLAQDLCDTFGKPVPANVQRLATTFKFALSYKLGSTRAPRTAEYF